MRDALSFASLRTAGLIAGAVGLCWIGTVAAQPAPADAVKELRSALQMHDPVPSTRDRRLRRAIEALGSIPDLRRALALNEWRDQDLDEELAAVDRAVRAAVAQRFEQAVRDLLKHGDPAERLWVIGMLADMGTTVRDLETKSGFARRFGPDLAILSQQEDVRLREAAAAALASINPDPAVAVQVFGRLLGSAEARQRFCGANGLARLMGRMQELATVCRSSTGIEASASEAVQTGCAVIPAAAEGLTDADPRVRRESIRAIALAAGMLSQLVRDRKVAHGLAGPDGNALWVQTAKPDELLPLILALEDQAPALACAVRDPDGQVRRLAYGVLQDMAEAQALLAPTVAEPLREALRVNLPALIDGLCDPAVHCRLSAIGVMETLGPAAAPASGALVKVLNDPDAFVRWAAARTLGRIGPVAGVAAVPALQRLLGDANPDVRVAAARALARFGPAAKPAVAGLANALKARDSATRLAALAALASLGQEAQPAATALQAALADPDDRVRQAAADVLGRLDPFSGMPDDVRQAGHREAPDR